MKKKFFSILFALVLVLSFSMIPGAPAGANGPTIELKPSEVGFYSMNSGMAEWSVEQNHTIGGTHSAKLTTTGAMDMAAVYVTWGCTIDDIATMSFWHFCSPNGASEWPRVAMELDTDHDGDADVNLVSSIVEQTPGTWQPWALVPETAFWWYVDPLTHENIPGPSYPVSFIEAQSAYTDAKVLTVAVYLGVDGNKIVYIDDLEVNGQVWDMEPTDDDCARTGEAVQIFVDDITANVEGTAVDEMSTTDPDGLTSIFDVAHAPKAVLTTTAKDLGGALTVTAVAQDNGAGTVTVTETPPAEYGLLACTDAVSDINDTAIYPTTPTQLTVTSLDDSTSCTETAPGPGEYMYIFITGTTGTGGAGTPINELLYILGTDTEETTTQTFGTISAYGVDATYSGGSAATALKISAENHVWVTYDWHQHDTVTVDVTNNQAEPCEIEVECDEVDPLTLQPNKDSGYFKGTFYLTDTCNDELDWLEVEHCNTVTAEYDLLTDSIGIDDEPPVFSNESPYPSTNESLPEISVDIDDDKCPVREESLRLFVDDVNPPTAGEVFDFVFENGTLTWTPSETLTDGTYYVRVKAADCCYNWAELDWSFDVESSPPMMIDAVTGWTWAWGPANRPVNSHTRTSIMVVFSEPLDPATVQASDFKVNYIIPADAEYHDYHWSCGNPNGYPYGLVFLTLATPLRTDATPTVVQYSDVNDLAGNPCSKPYLWACGELEQPQTVTAQDGIGPLITVTASPEEPGYNKMVTVTAQASEPLSEAYLYIGEGSPQDYCWDEVKPIGWPPEPQHQPESAWTANDWLVMEEGAGNTWTVSFLNTFGPDDPWFVEVAAHDFTQWQEDMDDPEDPGYWEDYECVTHDKCWKHEKWTEESFIFFGRNVYTVDLCEGWNLISVPRDLTDPTLQGFFGGIGQTKGVTRVYYYTGGQYGIWKYAALNPVTGYWYGTLSTIEPGKAYWVWCSPPRMKLLMTVSPPDPMSAPPSYSLVKGWNMLGYTLVLDGSPQYDPPYIKHYLIGLRNLGPTHLYFYDTCDYTDDGPGWVRIHSGGMEYWNWYDEEWPIGFGAWVWAHEATTFGP